MALFTGKMNLLYNYQSKFDDKKANKVFWQNWKSRTRNQPTQNKINGRILHKIAQIEAQWIEKSIAIVDLLLSHNDRMLYLYVIYMQYKPYLYYFL